MVKFGKYLAAHRVAEWQSQYVRYKQLKKLLKQVAAESAAPSDGSDSSGAVNNARQVALSSRQWAKTARLRVAEEEKNAPVFAAYMQQAHAHQASHAAANNSSAPDVLHHTDRFHSIGSAGPLHTAPDPRPYPASPPPAAASPHTPSPASSPASFPSDHSHVFTSLFAAHLPSQSSAERLFFSLLDSDLVTVNTFFLRQEEFFLSKAEVLSDQLQSLLSTPLKSTNSSASLLHPLGRKPQGDLPLHAQHVLERALKELYRGLQLLRNYKIMNYTASATQHESPCLSRCVTRGRSLTCVHSLCCAGV